MCVTDILTIFSRTKVSLHRALFGAVDKLLNKCTSAELNALSIFSVITDHILGNTKLLSFNKVMAIL